MISTDYLKHWTLPEYRPTDEQRILLNQIIDAVNNDYKNIIINAGTGIGKSAIGTTIANMFNSAYILTKTINLQKQYMFDFHSMLNELKGKKHYPCFYNNSCENCYIDYVNENGSVEDKLELLNTHGRTFEFYGELSDDEYYDIIDNMLLWKCDDCPYRLAISSAQKNDYVNANYHSLHANKFRFLKRDLIVFDECHNFENIMMSIVSHSINPDNIYDNYGVDVFDAEYDDLKSISYWIKIYQDIAVLLNERKSREVGNLQDRVDDNIIRAIELEFEQKIMNIEEKISNLSNGKWFINLPKGNEMFDSDKNNIIFKPLYGKDYTQKLLEMGEIRLFLTGTLPNPDSYIDWIGLNPDETKVFYLKSPFPASNRPIIKNYLGNFNSKFNKKINGKIIPAWQNDTVLDGIKSLLLKHSDKNIIIHTTSISQTDWLEENLTDFNVLTAYKEFRDENIKLFKDNDDFNILISPSITEGVDFKGDSATVQLIFKIPRPLWKDEVKQRAEEDPEYYNFHTIVQLMQSYGRIIRNASDRGITYICDAAFDDLLKYNYYLFEEYFLEGLEMGKFNEDILHYFFDF